MRRGVMDEGTRGGKRNSPVSLAAGTNDGIEEPKGINWKLYYTSREGEHGPTESTVERRGQEVGGS